ncbi:hypothetical protein [Candidatus Harpocratesius sp.]
MPFSYNPSSEYSQYHIQSGTSLTQSQQKIVQILRNLGVNVSFSTISEKIFLIPPNGAVFLLNSNDLRPKKIDNLLKYIKQFLYQYPMGIIIAENFQRWGNSTNEKFQNLLLLLFFKVNRSSNILPTFIPSRKIEDSVEILLRIAHREQVSDKPPTLSRISGKNIYLANAQINFIQGLLNCGRKKAEKLLEIFDSPYTIIRTIIDEPNKIEEIQGFGSKFISQNRKMLSDFLN